MGLLFQSTRSAWSATPVQGGESRAQDFNPRAPHGARPHTHWSRAFLLVFQSTRSAWSATSARAASQLRRMGRRFQSTRSAWSATPQLHDFVERLSISIHALRMERDVSIKRYPGLQHNFNPRAPHGARRCSASPLPRPGRDFNPRAPHGARRCWWLSFDSPPFISIHALRMERDPFGRAHHGALAFQSTRSAWSATLLDLSHVFFTGISIHALRMERDLLLC